MSLLFIKIFELALRDQLAAHVEKDKTIANIKQFFFWPGMNIWINQLIAGRLDCQKNEQKHNLSQKILEQGTDRVHFPFHTVHIVVVASFSRFVQVNPVANNNATETIQILEQFVLTFGTAFKKQTFLWMAS